MDFVASSYLYQTHGRWEMVVYISTLKMDNLSKFEQIICHDPYSFSYHQQSFYIEFMFSLTDFLKVFKEYLKTGFKI